MASSQSKGSKNTIILHLSEELEEKSREKALKEGYKSLQEKIRAFLINDLGSDSNESYKAKAYGIIAGQLAGHGFHKKAEELINKYNSDIQNSTEADNRIVSWKREEYKKPDSYFSDIT